MTSEQFMTPLHCEPGTYALTGEARFNYDENQLRRDAIDADFAMVAAYNRRQAEREMGFNLLITFGGNEGINRK